MWRPGGPLPIFYLTEAFIVEGYFIGFSQESPFIFVFSLVRRVVSNFF